MEEEEVGCRVLEVQEKSPAAKEETIPKTISGTIQDNIFKTAGVVDTLKGKQKPLKLNTSSTVHMEQTVSDPNFDQILFCLSAILHSQIVENKSEECLTLIENNYQEFIIKSAADVKDRSEVDDSLSNSLEEEIPSIDTIFEYLKAELKAINFSVECSIISLIYINRVCSISNMEVTTKSWKGLWVGSIALAMKVWDTALNKSSLEGSCSIFANRKLVRLLTFKTFHLLNFHTGVKPSLYTLYYFELRELFFRICGKAEHLGWKDKPLSIVKERQMEERSKRRNSVKFVCTDIFSTRHTDSFRTRLKIVPENTNLTYEDVSRSDTSRFVIS